MSLVTVAPSPANTGTTITVSDLEDFPVTFPFYMAIGAAGQIFDNTNSTNVQVTGIAGGVYTIVRDVLNSSPRSILVGDECQLAVSSGSGSGGASIVDALGDLLVGSGPDALTRLAMGNAGDVLSTKLDATGLKWGQGLALLDTYITPSSVASVTISLPSTVSGGSLLCTWGARLTGTYVSNYVWMQFNGDNAANYTERWMGRDGGVYSEGDTASGVAAMYVGQFPGASGSTNRYGSGFAFVENWTNTNKHKNLIAVIGGSPSGTDNQESNLLAGGTWKNTARLTSVTWKPYDNFAVSSRFSVWHIAHQ